MKYEAYKFLSTVCLIMTGLGGLLGMIGRSITEDITMGFNGVVTFFILVLLICGIINGIIFYLELKDKELEE